MSTPQAFLGKESIFSDLDNLEVVTTTAEKYEDSFGFTQQEVEDVLDEYGLSGQVAKVREWYDGFTFGTRRDMYNPWSILNYIDKKRFAPYWANTSSNSLAGKLIREGSARVKNIMEDLLEGKTLHTEIDEQIIFNQLDASESAIWSLLLASGYLRVENYTFLEEWGREEYDLVLTNKEVRIMFERMIRGWFAGDGSVYNDFVEALLRGNKIEEKRYAATLEAKGIATERIRKYGFAFEGKKVLIG